MADDPITYDTVVRLIEEQFAFLLARGFHLLPARSSDQPVLVVVMIAAKRVGLLFSYDRRDGVIDVEVESMADARVPPCSWNLDTYLRTFCGYRGGYSDGITIKHLQSLEAQPRLERDIRWYAGIIRAHAPRVVDDTEEFVQPGLNSLP